MLKGHPKGLLVAFFANMGERFGFYTMMGILVLFLQARFGLAEENAGLIYSVFYAAIYALALVGGIVADRVAGMKKTITLGIVMMALGYFILALPVIGIEMGLIPVCFGLFVIAFGNGMFKGNLQAVVGNLYEKKEYSHLRDSAFSIFYMGINVGALFAPTVAVKLRDWYLNSQGFIANKKLPALCHEYIGTGTSSADLQMLAEKASLNGSVNDLGSFASSYIEAFSTGYNYAFGFAAIMMLVSLIVYFVFNKHLVPGFAVPAATTADGKVVAEMPAKEVKERIVALCLVFAVVIFFWMSFHQNGLTLTFFARDYTSPNVAPATSFWFDLSVLLPIFGAALGIYMLIKKIATSKERLIGLVLAGGFGALAYYTFNQLPASTEVSPELFQHLNPFFIVSLTPIVVGIFSWLNKKGLEPTAPRKIAYGMILASLGFVVLLIASLNLASPADVKGGMAATEGISPYWLISTYFVLTIAELFLSPMGISFVSKVAPPKFKGMMQGLWLCATAVGNQLLFIGAIFYNSTALWITWGFFVVCCIVSAIVMFSLLKRIERVAK